jgi:hypothetical protein
MFVIFDGNWIVFDDIFVGCMMVKNEMATVIAPCQFLKLMFAHSGRLAAAPQITRKLRISLLIPLWPLGVECVVLNFVSFVTSSARFLVRGEFELRPGRP